MTEEMSAEMFSKHLNTIFRIPVPEAEALELELITVEEFPPSPNQERFSLIFRGPLDRGVYQGVYDFEHDALGTISIFVVPLSQKEDGVRYEAVFNRLKKNQ